MNPTSFVKSLLLAMWLVALAVAEEDGIFADFQTSMGDFTCKLEYGHAPWAVANFIGLAEGSRPWVDPATGAVRGGPFYDGITFHRVIDGFMNQSGSRSGLGNDGPGYTFRDELDNGLFHDAAGVLSMANSGPQTNGSQFFVTVAPTPHLDGLHTVFGSVVAGMDVVMAINAVPKQPAAQGEAPSRPVTPVVLERVIIRRVGAAAEAFDIHAQDLPICRPLPGSLDVEKGQRAEFIADTPIGGSTMLQGWRSTNLQSWQYLGRIYSPPGVDPYPSVTVDNASAPRAFFHLSVTEYPVAFGPRDNRGRTLTLEWDGVNGGDVRLIYHFNAQGNGGTFDWIEEGADIQGQFSLFDFSSEPLRATWIFQHTPGLDPIRIRGHFATSTTTHHVGGMRRDFFLGNDLLGNPVWGSTKIGDLSLSR